MALAVPLAATGLAFAAAGSAHAAAGGPTSVTICHSKGAGAVGSPYNSITVAITNPDLNGHTNDTGPIYSVGAASWGDIIPPFDYTDKAGTTTHFGGLNWTTEGQAILANGCNMPTSVDPVAPTLTQAGCSGGVVSDPTLTLAGAPAGVAYKAVPSRPYTAGEPVTVTATITDPALWFQSPAPTGWTFVDVGHETYSFTFAAAPACGTTTLVPDVPTWTEATCNAGTITGPTLDPLTTAGITYTEAPSAPYSAGSTVTVTATIGNPAVNSFAAPGTRGWSYVDASHETFVITFAPAPACGGAGGVSPTVITAVAPTFGDPGCGTSGVTAPFVTLPGTPSGVAYTVSPSGPYVGGQTVKVTATITDPAEQFASPGTGGWTFVDAQHETITHTFAAAPTCSGVGGLKAVAATPTFADASCVHGALTGASYTLPARDGVRYVVDGRRRAAGTYAAVSGSTVTIRRIATAGFTLRDATPVTHTFPAAPRCLGVEPVSTSRPPASGPGTTPPLASTGVPADQLGWLGAFAVLAGVAMMFGGRRRRRTSC